MRQMRMCCGMVHERVERGGRPIRADGDGVELVYRSFRRRIGAQTAEAIIGLFESVRST